MNINTKFNLGNIVWIMKDNKCHSFIIDKIIVTLEKIPTSNIGYGYNGSRHVKYHLYECGENLFNENELHATKEELIATL